MEKAKEISALWAEIKPKIGQLIHLCYQVEDRAEKAEKSAEVTADAYQRGFEAGKMDAYVEDSQNITMLKEDAEKALRKGQDSAWWVAGKISLNPTDNGYSYDELEKIFGSDSLAQIFKTYSAAEAIEKINNYEYEKAREEKEQEKKGLRQNIQTIIDQCGYSLDEICEIVQEMKEAQ